MNEKKDDLDELIIELHIKSIKKDYEEYKELLIERKNIDDPKLYKKNAEYIWLYQKNRAPLIKRQKGFIFI